MKALSDHGASHDDSVGAALAPGAAMQHTPVVQDQHLPLRDGNLHFEFRAVDHLIPHEVCSVPLFELLEWNGAWRSEDLVELHSHEVSFRISLDDGVVGRQQHRLSSFLRGVDTRSHKVPLLAISVCAQHLKGCRIPSSQGFGYCIAIYQGVVASALDVVHHQQQSGDAVGRHGLICVVVETSFLRIAHADCPCLFLDDPIRFLSCWVLLHATKVIVYKVQEHGGVL
mmetsp:Transcript_100668/g.123263  ORF Transcript_100668/g.123263 Transcript_100668/m.123263 type:complete len:227 (+) Transcript_100668:294-974(+)